MGRFTLQRISSVCGSACLVCLRHPLEHLCSALIGPIRMQVRCCFSSRGMTTVRNTRCWMCDWELGIKLKYYFADLMLCSADWRLCSADWMLCLLFLLTFWAVQSGSWCGQPFGAVAVGPTRLTFVSIGFAAASTPLAASIVQVGC